MDPVKFMKTYQEFLDYKATTPLPFDRFKADTFDKVLQLFLRMEKRQYRVTSCTKEGKLVVRYESCPKGHGCDVCMKKYGDYDTVTSGKTLFHLQKKLEEVNEDTEYAHAYTVHEFTRSHSICGDCLVQAKTLLKKLETKLANTSKHYKKYAPKMEGYHQRPLVNKMYYI